MRLFRRPDGRYYACTEPMRDLLGNLVLVTFHGNKRNRAGGIKTYVVGAAQSVAKIERAIVRTRLAHGYSEERV